MRLQSIAAKAGFAALLAAALIAGAAVAGTRLGYWGVGAGYRLMAPAAGLAALAFAASALWLFLALKRNSGEAKRFGLIGFVGAILLLYGPAGFAWRTLTMPPINDATSDTEHPPQFVTLGAMPYRGDETMRFGGETATMAYFQHNYYEEITHPIAKLFPGVTDPTAKLFWRALEAANAMGWSVISFDPKAERIEAVETSFWFGRKTDIVIRVRPAGSLGARPDIRCVSRDAAPDGGSAIFCARNYLEKLNKL